MLVAHEGVDAAEILAGAHCAGVVVREVVEQFRGELAHGGMVGEAGC